MEANDSRVVRDETHSRADKQHSTETVPAVMPSWEQQKRRSVRKASDLSFGGCRKEKRDVDVTGYVGRPDGACMRCIMSTRGESTATLSHDEA